MTKGTETSASGRMLQSSQVADIPKGAKPAPWKPAVLTGQRTYPPLEMQLAQHKEAAEKAREPKPARERQTAPPEPQDGGPIAPDESMEQIAARRPIDVARAVSTLLMQADGESAGLPADLKVAILIVGLGSDLSAGVIKYLAEPKISQIARAVAELESVTTRQRDDVFDEVKHLISGNHLLQGGTAFARNLLEKALGERKGRAMMWRVSGTTERKFDLFRNIDPEQIVSFIAREHPQTIALILSQLDAKQAAGVLNGLSEELQDDVILRITQMETISPEALSRLEQGLAEDIHAILAGQVEVGGQKAAAEIVKQAEVLRQKREESQNAHEKEGT